jgi:hypothetical protein
VPEVDEMGEVVPGQIFFTFRNFVIPPGANPILPDGGTADLELHSDQNENGEVCGRLVMSLFEPFMIDSDGTFRAGLAGTNDPTTAECD